MTGLDKINQYRKNLEKFFEKEVKIPETVLRPAKVADEYSRFDWFLYYANQLKLITDEEFSKTSIQLLSLLMGTDNTPITFTELTVIPSYYDKLENEAMTNCLNDVITQICRKRLSKHQYLGFRYLLLFCVTVGLITDAEFIKGHLALSRYECQELDGKRS